MTKGVQLEIRRRVTSEIETAEWLQRVARPHGQTLFGAVPVLALIETELAAHVERLKGMLNLV